MQPWHRPDPPTRNMCFRKESRFTLRTGAERARMLAAGGRGGEDVRIFNCHLSRGFPGKDLSCELVGNPTKFVANIRDVE